jgi:hypothetical protein
MHHFVARAALGYLLGTSIAACSSTPIHDACIDFGSSGTYLTLHELRAKPAQSELMHQLASQTPGYAARHGRLPYEHWLQSASGVVLCETDRKSPKDTCEGQWWRFKELNGVWSMEAHNEWGCIT